MLNLVRIFGMLAVLLFSSSVLANESGANGSWHVTEIEGHVQVAGEPIAVGACHQFVGGLVTTGANARAVLVRGDQRIVLGAGARITISGGDTPQSTQIVQADGRATYKVDRRGKKHFEVRTRQVAAVVKGTEFVVNADGDNHEVVVTEGLVEVTSMATGIVEMVSAGRRVRSAANGGLNVSNASKVEKASEKAKTKSSGPEGSSDEGSDAPEASENEQAVVTTAPAVIPVSTAPTPVRSALPGGSDDTPADPPVENTDLGNNNQIDGGGNIVDGSNNAITGDTNEIFKNNNIIVGDLNFVSGNNNEVSGFTNKIYGMKNFVEGNDNTIGSTIADFKDNSVRGVWIRRFDRGRILGCP